VARKRKRQPKSSRLERWHVVVGTAGGIATLVTFALALPANVAEAFHRPNPKRDEIERKRERAQETAARLEVSYLFVESGLLGREPSRRPASKLGATLLSYPVEHTEIADEQAATATGCGMSSPVQTTAFLLIENHGHREANDLTIRVERLRLRRRVVIREPPAGRDVYLAKLRAAADATTTTTIVVARSVPRGEGVLVPLWLTTTAWRKANPWCVSSRTALVPLTVRFRDTYLGWQPRTLVRRLRAPEIIESGIEGRG